MLRQKFVFRREIIGGDLTHDSDREMWYKLIGHVVDHMGNRSHDASNATLPVKSRRHGLGNRTPR